MREISPLLNNKINQKHQTHYNNADPKMGITVARARSSIIDSEYFNIEQIRRKDGISDISLSPRRLDPNKALDGLYEIHIDNGIAKTTIREYPDLDRKGWRHQFTVGNAKSVAIAFDGRWILNDKGHWLLITEEVPSIFWVDDNNDLRVQKWDNVESERKLAEDVEEVKAIRAWKNVNILEHDQGLLAVYIKKDGKVYYRGFCRQEDGEYIWEVERQIEEFVGVAENINLFITNDYRTGIIIEDNQGNIQWLITERNWAGMAIGSDSIVSNIGDTTIELISVNYQDINIGAEYIIGMPGESIIELRYANTDNKFINIYNEPTIDGEEDWGKILMFETKHRLYNLTVADIEIMGSRGSFIADTIEEIGDRKYKLTFEGVNSFNNAGKNPTLRLNKGVTANGINVPYETFEKKFKPLNLVPEFIPLPEVEAIWNE